jgi:fumarylacetoacetase
MLDPTHDPKLQSWVASANEPGADFPIQNLPFCTFGNGTPGVGIGDQIVDIARAFSIRSLIEVMSMTSRDRIALRHRISAFLAKGSQPAGHLLTPIAEAELQLPCAIGDYTDFYASIHHATNVGSMFRPDNPLLPNYKWVPVAYHGRASSIVPSGTPVRRPCGQTAEHPGGPPKYGPSRRLDYELEIGAFLGPGNTLGSTLPIAEAEDHLFGVCLLNDWSARDIQTWEYQPLGPFLAKNFATSISPWIVTREALAPFRTTPLPHDETLPYLTQTTPGAFRIQLEVRLNGARISQSDFGSMYWTLGQMIAHHASNGCPLRPGDLIGSGTVSGPEKRNRGCLLELTWRGTEPITLPSGETRTFLEDGDEVTLRGYCEAPGAVRIGLGECSGTVQSAAGMSASK